MREHEVLKGALFHKIRTVKDTCVRVPEMEVGDIKNSVCCCCGSKNLLQFLVEYL